MFRTAFTMDVGVPKLFGIEAGKREQSKLLQSPPGDLVSAAGLMATAGVSSGTRIPVVSIVGCTAAAGDSVGAGGAATESWVDGVSATTGVAIAGGSIAGRTTSAGVVVGAGRTVIAGISATGPASARIVANEETHTMATIANRFMIISFNFRVVSALRPSIPPSPSLRSAPKSLRGGEEQIRSQHHCWCGALCNAYCGVGCDCKTLLATLVIMPSRPTIANRCMRRRMGDPPRFRPAKVDARA